MEIRISKNRRKIAIANQPAPPRHYLLKQSESPDNYYDPVPNWDLFKILPSDRLAEKITNEKYSALCFLLPCVIGID